MLAMGEKPKKVAPPRGIRIREDFLNNPLSGDSGRPRHLVAVIPDKTGFVRYCYSDGSSEVLPHDAYPPID